MVIRISHVALGFVLLLALLPMPNQMLSMEAMGMDAVSSSQYYVLQGNAVDNSTGSCCEAIGSFLLACDFMVFQSACVDVDGGSDQIAYSVPIVQSIFIESLAPPPKA